MVVTEVFAAAFVEYCSDCIAAREREIRGYWACWAPMCLLCPRTACYGETFSQAFRILVVSSLSGQVPQTWLAEATFCS